jgi:hypothetical protein
VPDADHANVKDGVIFPDFDGQKTNPLVAVAGARAALPAEFLAGG